MNSNFWRRRAMRPRAFQISAGAGRQAMTWLVRAHRAFEQGLYGEAAEIFEQLGVMAETRGDMRAAPLFFQASRANLLDGQAGDAVALAQHGLGILAVNNRWEAFDRRGRAALAQLERVGGDDLACQLREWIDDIKRPALSNAAFDPSQSGTRTTLPIKCPSCGGPVDPREVEWVDEYSALCDFCGTLMRGQTI